MPTDPHAPLRPREKLIARGAASLGDDELLAILLRTGSQGTRVLELARQLLAQWGGLRGVLECDIQIFCRKQGLGPAKYAQLQAALELSRRWLERALERGEALENSTDTRRYLLAQLRPCAQEVFAVLFLDNRHRIIRFEKMFHGTIHSAAVYPREVVKRALQHNAAALICAHNHPSGVAEPSSGDLQLTRQLRQAVELLDIRLLDHIIVGDTETVSLAERGWL